MNVAAYLARIGYRGAVTPTAETLRQLHRAHLLAVPFENLDIPLGRKIVLDQDRLVYKVVELRRGGFCYELNGAFAALLTALRFRVTLLSARVPREDGSAGPEFDHLTLRVDLDEPWLADVGFGDSFLEPLRLRLGLEQKQGGRVFRIVERGDDLQVERSEGQGWKPEYQFTLLPRDFQEFAEMCHYHQTSPESPFTRKRLCTRATRDGRITLSDLKLVTTRNGRKEERVLASEEERRLVLAELFGVVLEQAAPQAAN
jgi:N-hydroxyarylamine O-acetyltransferase